MNCNNQNPNQNPYPYPFPFPGTTPILTPGTTIPVIRGRGFDVPYNKVPMNSKLEFQRRRSDSSEESNESRESRESSESSEEVDDHRRPNYSSHHVSGLQHSSLHSTSSEEDHYHHHRPSYQPQPTHHTDNVQIPSIHNTVDSKLDFMRRQPGSEPRNHLRQLTRNHVPGHHVTPTADKLNINIGVPQIVDQTHGHGHGGQYNHNVESNVHGHNYGYVPSHVPSRVFIPSNVIVDPHMRPEHVVPIEHFLLPGATVDTYATNPSNLNILLGIPQVGQPMLPTSGVMTGPHNQAVNLVHDPRIGVPLVNRVESIPSVLTSGPLSSVDVLHDTRDRLTLTQRGYRALDTPIPGQLYPEDLLNRFFMMNIPTVTQDGLNTEITCEPIPIVPPSPTASTLPAVPTVPSIPTVPVVPSIPTVPVVPSIPTIPQTLTTGQTLQGENGMLPGAESLSTVITSDNMDGISSLSPAHGESTVTKVTTTKVEERPSATGIRVPMQESGSTVTKVTTTTTKNDGPIITNVLPHQTVVSEESTNNGQTVTKVTTTTVEERPISTHAIGETIINEPVQTVSNSGSTVTKVTTTTTTNTEEQPISITIPQTVVHEMPQESGSTVTKVTTTTTTEDRPTITSHTSTSVHNNPGSIDGK